MREWIQRLRLIDDAFMQACFQDNPQCVELVLRIIMNMPDLQVERVSVQKRLHNLRGHSLQLDIAARDSQNRLYNIEIQRGDAGAEAARVRYHCSLIDASALRKGQDFHELPQTYVIFITEHDVLGGGLPLYTIERVIKETGMDFGDGAHIIYVNGEQREGETELARLMHDFFCANPTEMHYERLAEVTNRHKTDEKEMQKMSGVFEEYAEMVAQRREQAAEARGEARGKLEERQRVIRKMVQAGRMSLDEIAEYVEMSVDTVRTLAAMK